MVVNDCVFVCVRVGECALVREKKKKESVSDSASFAFGLAPSTALAGRGGQCALRLGSHPHALAMATRIKMW